MDPDDELSPSERDRDRRRDRDATAKERAGMRTGLAKQFKQVLDTQRKRGEDAARRLEDGASEGQPGAARRSSRRERG